LAAVLLLQPLPALWRIFRLGIDALCLAALTTVLIASMME
jgi:hypothetical protein